MADRGMVALLEEHLSPLRPVVFKRMFGGVGVFRDGLMLGLVADGILYLKTDEASRADFEREGMAPFTYQRRDGAATVMSYYRAPDRLLDAPDELVTWARRALLVASRAASARAKGRVRGGRIG
jgi:DNA transformation protein and related proteins